MPRKEDLTLLDRILSALVGVLLGMLWIASIANGAENPLIGYDPIDTGQCMLQPINKLFPCVIMEKPNDKRVYFAIVSEDKKDLLLIIGIDQKTKEQEVVWQK